jgi:hypothetical protein
MSNSCHFLLQKQGGKRHYLKIHWPKTFQLTLSIRGSNQIECIKCKSRDIAQGRVTLFMPVKHTIGTLSANQPETIRMLKT